MGLRSEVLLKREEKDPAKETLYRLLAGIFVTGLVEGIFLLVLCNDKGAAVFGLLLGLWVAAVNAVYIYRSLGKALELDEKNSVKAMRGPVMVRYCFMGIAVALGLLRPHLFSPVGVILGLLSMKVSAYAQPFFMKRNPDAKPLPEDEWEEEEQSPWGFGVFHNGNSRTEAEEKEQKAEQKSE